MVILRKNCRTVIRGKISSLLVLHLLIKAQEMKYLAIKYWSLCKVALPENPFKIFELFVSEVL